MASVTVPRDDIAATRFRDPGTHSAAVTACLDVHEPGSKFGRHYLRAVRAAVVGNDHFGLDSESFDRFLRPADT